MADIIVNPAQATAPIDIVCGNAEAEIVRFVFDRYSDGVDLAGLAWSVSVKNSGGFSDLYMEDYGIIDVYEQDDKVVVRWQLFGTATAATGRLLYQLEGLLGKAVIKRFPVRTLNIVSYLATSLSSDAEDDHANLRATIEYVGNELPKILAAEKARAEAFNRIELYVQKSGRITKVTAVDPDGIKSVATVLDGENMQIRAAYDTLDALMAAHPEGYLGDVYAVGAAPDIELYFWDVEKKGWQLLGTVEVSLPDSLLIDEEVTANGENPVTGAAIYAFVRNNIDSEVAENSSNPVSGSAVHGFVNAFIGTKIPTPSKEDAGLVLKVQEDGSYGLGEGGAKDAVLYTKQELTISQQRQARDNIGFGDGELVADHITAGTLGGQVQANATAAAVVSVPQLRNILMTATDPGAGATVDYPDGTVIHVYE